MVAPPEICQVRFCGPKTMPLWCWSWPRTVYCWVWPTLRLAVDGRLFALYAAHADALARRDPDALLASASDFEELGALTHYLQDQFLPRLRRTVKVVISGRQPLGVAWSAWGPVVQSIGLSGFPPEASRAYLRVRGIGPDLEDEITGAAGGSPLALALAADMATQLGVREFEAAPEWRLALRGLVEDLLRDVRNQDLRFLLEAAAVVRQFDEELLAAVVGKDDITAEFAALCALSSIRPAEHGLPLHDDIRRVLIEDLRWRRPQRLVELRRRAWRHYRRRMRESGAATWIIADQLHLSGNDVIRAMLFTYGGRRGGAGGGAGGWWRGGGRGGGWCGGGGGGAGGRGAPPSREAIDQARDNLEKFSVVGNLERPASLVQQIEQGLGFKIRLGRARKSPVPEQERNALVNERILERVRELCAPDLQVYELANSIAAHRSRPVAWAAA
jgi:hypothetical protein